MGEDTQTLDEVVVTALGIKREQKALSYNVQQVKGDELTNIKDANFINALSGKVAGVTINASSAGAGAAARVVMRGTKSLEKNDNALYVIDGIPMFNIFRKVVFPAPFRPISPTTLWGRSWREKPDSTFCPSLYQALRF